MTTRADPAGLADLFDLVPLPTCEEDFSAVREHLGALGLVGRPEAEVAAAIEAHPAILAEIIERVRIARANRACLALHRADSEDALRAELDGLVGGEAKHALIAQLVAVCAGRTELETDGVIRTLDGERRDVHIVWRVLPGCERSFRRVLVTTEDITERMRAEDALARRLRELEAVTSIGRRLDADIGLESLVKATLGAVKEAVAADTALLYVVEGGALRLAGSMPALTGTHTEGAAPAWGECLCGLAASTSSAVYSSRLAEDPRCTRGECKLAGFASFAAVPFVADGRVLGVLGLANHAERDLAEYAQFLDAVASTASLSLRNALLFDEVRRHEAHLELEIAGRLHAEQLLRREVALSDAIIRSLPAVFYVFDETGRFLRWNRLLETATGYSTEEIAALHPLDLFVGPDREIVVERIAEVFKRGQSTVEAVLTTKDGARVPFLFTGVRCELEGRPYLSGVGIDLTQRLEVERKLRNLSLAINASGDVVFITDRDGLIESINSRFTELYGYSCEEVVGRVTPRIFKSGRQAAEVYEAFWRSISRGQLFRGEVVNLTKDGREIVVDETVSPFFDGTGEVRGFLAIQRDITHRRRIEEERERLGKQLAESQRLEALGRLAGGVAHDFNNLLTVIICSAQMMEASLTGSRPRNADIEAILDASDRARALTAQLLAFSRRQVLAVEVVGVNGVVREMKALLDRLLGEHIEIVVELMSERDAILADCSQLEQVILNLAVNARDAMGGGGRLTITTSDVSIADANDVMPGPGRWVKLTVRDTGAGMDAETLGHIFEPFFTTKERGSGLGLATVYGIVKQSGGSIRVDSAPGGGTRFDVFLPEATVEMPAPKAPRPRAAAGGDEDVLLVEDDASVREVAARILRRAGYRVTEAVDGERALALLERQETDFALVITDVVMPNMGGGELVSYFTARGAELKVLFVSGYSADAMNDTDLLAAGRHFLEKPFTAQGLIAKVRQVLDEG